LTTNFDHYSAEFVCARERSYALNYRGGEPD
jgi:hypothetical protein